MKNLDLPDEKFLLNFVKIKKAAKLERIQIMFTFFFLFAAFFSNLFDKPLTSGFIVGAIFLLSFSLIQKTTYQLIELVEHLVASDADYIKKVSELR